MSIDSPLPPLGHAEDLVLHLRAEGEPLGLMHGGMLVAIRAREAQIVAALLAEATRIEQSYDHSQTGAQSKALREFAGRLGRKP